MRRIASLACAAALIGCSGTGETPPAPVSTSTTEHELPYFVDIAAEAGLDTAQIGGGDDVDYIIESLGTGGAWLDYDGDGDPDLYLV